MGRFNFDSGSEQNAENLALLISSLLVKDSCISELWKLDVLGMIESSLSKSKFQLQEDTQKCFEWTLSVNSEERYEVALSWLLDSSVLPD